MRHRSDVGGRLYADPMSQDAASADSPTGEMPEVAPSKPLAPRTPVRDRPAPEPVDVDLGDAHIVNPVASPEAHEVAPEPSGPFDSLPTESAPEATAPLTSVELLGRAAAANASLSASGAPTPLGGIPRVDASGATPVEIADDSPRWAPTFMGASTTAAAAPPAPASEAAPVPTIALNRHQLGSDLPLYRPRMAGDGHAVNASDPAAGHADELAAGPEPAGIEAAPAAGPTPGRAWPLVLIGLLTMAGITLALTWPLLHPEAIELPAQRVLGTPTTVDNGLVPVVLEEPSEFLRAIPQRAGSWTMVGASSTQSPAGRVAEWHTLRYSDGSATVALEARQYFSAASAHDALVRAAGPDAVFTDATVAGEVVGERVEREEDGTTRIMWTHGSAYFEAVGPSEQVAELVAALQL